MRLSVRAAVLFSVVAGSLPAAPVDYARQIKPMFQAACVKCHGATTQKSKLKLDTAAAVLKGGENGAAIQPGKSSDSLLIQAIEGTHAEIPKMPYKRPPLDSAQVALIKQWINEGAKNN